MNLSSKYKFKHFENRVALAWGCQRTLWQIAKFDKAQWRLAAAVPSVSPCKLFPNSANF
jgi:hypothetical protein